MLPYSHFVIRPIGKLFVEDLEEQCAEPVCNNLNYLDSVRSVFHHNARKHLYKVKFCWLHLKSST